MADLNFNCPKCEQNLTTDESLSGSKIDCPSCNTPFEVPSAGDENVERTEAEPPPPVTGEPEPKKLDYDRRYIKGGFLVSEQTKYKPLKLASPPQVENLNPNQIKAFESILDMISTREPGLILFQVPFARDKYESHQAINPVFDRQMNQYGRYYNLNETMHLVDTIHFRDEFHLNLTGVSLLNDEIIDLLSL